MSIKVCDAIMGSGKTSAAITYMNEHEGERFIYITPYLEEAARIKKSCPKLGFVEPRDDIPECHFKKGEHAAVLIENGRNIATTHQAFLQYTQEMIEAIQGQGYTLFIDENVDSTETTKINGDDLQIMFSTGYLRRTEKGYERTDKQYNGGVFSKTLSTWGKQELIVTKENGDARGNLTITQWFLSPELVNAFKDVYIMTYFFKGQEMRSWLEVNNMSYSHIGVQKYIDGTYHFADRNTSFPDYIKDLKSLIHIEEDKRYNEIGKNYHSLSSNWLATRTEKTKELKSLINSYMRYKWENIPASDKMWSTTKQAQKKLSGKGYTKSFVPLNARASNNYSNRHHLIYAVNVFVPVSVDVFYKEHGIEINRDDYALSTMLQWIWRSGIRNGEDIWIYIPSRRMRTLLKNWINETVDKALSGKFNDWEIKKIPDSGIEYEEAD